MQGANTAGGLGLDKEFIESVMATQVVLYGFLGFHPTYDGFEISPQLPKDWPELTVTRIYLHDQILNISADSAGGLRISGAGPKQGAGGSCAGESPFIIGGWCCGANGTIAIAWVGPTALRSIAQPCVANALSL